MGPAPYLPDEMTKQALRSTPASRALVGLLALLVGALLLGSETPPAPPPTPPLVGFSYSPELSQWMGTDPADDLATLLNSIRTVLFAFPDDTVVYPGHGEPTTIGVEKRTNPFLIG